MDRTVLKVSIHLYFQRAYVMIPAKGKKNEYHRRVSPMVRMGGRSSEIHMLTIKAKNTSNPVIVHPNVNPGCLPFHALIDPAPQKHKAITANIGN